MDRFARFFCDPIKVLKFLCALCFGILIIAYVYHQSLGVIDDEIETEMSYLITLNQDISGEAVIFRDETVIEKPADGTVVTLVSEGERVSKGQMIANIYNDKEDASLQDEFNRIQRRLNILEGSAVNKEYMISDITKLDGEIGEIFKDIHDDSSNGDLSSVVDASSELLIKLNKRDLIVESDFDVSKELEKLYAEKAELQSRINSISSPVYATSSGTFYGEIDGYEEIFDVSDVRNITLDSFDEISGSKRDENLVESGLVKIVDDFIWYIVCSVDAEETAQLRSGRNYTVSFPENADFEITMNLDKIVKETGSSKALAVFRINVFPDGFDYKRYQKANIILNDVEGLSVPKKALRIVNGIEGVFILEGDVVRFRRIERIDEKDDYYIVKQKLNNELFEDETADAKTSLYEYLSLYDSIIISGKNLFDGKIVG